MAIFDKVNHGIHLALLAAGGKKQLAGDLKVSVSSIDYWYRIVKDVPPARIHEMSKQYGIETTLFKKILVI